MRFSRFLPFVALASAVPAPVSVARDANLDAAINLLLKRSAAPAPAAAPLAHASAELEMASLLASRQLDLSDLTGLLANLSASFSAIEALLTPTSLNNIEAVVTDLSSLFASPTTDQTKSLISTASDLLGSDSVKSLISELPTLLSSVSGLLTPALITNLTDILAGAHILLTPAFATETVELISDVAPVSYLAFVLHGHWYWKGGTN